MKFQTKLMTAFGVVAAMTLGVSLLGLWGYTVLEAQDGGAAVRLAAEHKGPIHLVLTDVVMLGMSGREVAERLTKLRSGVRMLFMSGYTGDVVMGGQILDRGTSYVQKPFTPDDLARAVRAVLDAPPGV